MSFQDWDLRHFRLLDALARSGSIGEAARLLGLAQPNASRLLESMERGARFPLVVRSPRGSRLTDRGLVLAGLAAEVLAATAQLGHAVQALAEERGTLRICASLTVAEHLMPAWLATARQQLPHLAITLDVGNSASVFTKLEEGTAELGFVEGPTVRTGHRYLDIVRDDLLLVVPSAHPWARTGRVEPEELLAGPLVVREEGSGTRQVTDQALARLTSGGALPGYLEVGSNAALVASVVAGLGPGVVSRLAVASELATGRLTEIRIPGLRLARTLRAVWPARGGLGPDGEAFLRLVESL